MLATIYHTEDMITAFVMGMPVGVALLFLCFWVTEKVGEFKEFKAFRNRKPAGFKNSKPSISAAIPTHTILLRERPHAELSSSQALVRRTNLERRKRDE
ncbi:MAG TPA: hypothetical protein VF762_13870 [Blastocatellia bacterium]|jgi:hypothetical protein